MQSCCFWKNGQGLRISILQESHQQELHDAKSASEVLQEEALALKRDLETQAASSLAVKEDLDQQIGGLNTRIQELEASLGGFCTPPCDLFSYINACSLYGVETGGLHAKRGVLLKWEFLPLG